MTLENYQKYINKYGNIIYSLGLNETEQNLFESSNFDKCNEETLKGILKNIKKSFSIIINSEIYDILIVDRLRSYPLFYKKEDNKVGYSDKIGDFLDESTFLDEEAIKLFKASGFFVNTRTFINDVRQIEAGTYIIYNKKDNSYKEKTYYSYKKLGSKTFPLEKLDIVYNNSIKRLIEKANGRTIVVPLSAGEDSRLIIKKLREFNYENVLCYTYGTKGNKEALISKKIAEKYKYNWCFVEYKKSMWKDLFNSDELLEFTKYSLDKGGLPHLLDFMAVREMLKEGKVRTDSLFCPGHSGDFVAGTHIPNTIYENERYNKSDLFKYLISKHYYLNNVSNPIELKREMEKTFNIETESFSPEKYAELIEYWDWKERQSKFIVNSVRVYEYYGLDWDIPLWDFEIMDTWNRTCYKHKIERNYYLTYSAKYIKKQENIKSSYISEVKNNIKDRIYSITIIKDTYKTLNYFIHPMGWYTEGFYNYLSKYLANKDYNINSRVANYSAEVLLKLKKEGEL